MTVTVGVKCFNNVRYIREALESAFRQTYRPLEIVVCDDCSTDGSWEAIGEVVEAHLGEPGLHVVVERNESNLGNLGNWERICGLATGDFPQEVWVHGMWLPREWAACWKARATLSPWS